MNASQSDAQLVDAQSVRRSPLARLLRALSLTLVTVLVLTATAAGSGYAAQQWWAGRSSHPVGGASGAQTTSGPGAQADSAEHATPAAVPSAATSEAPEAASGASEPNPEPELAPEPALWSAGDTGEGVRVLQARLIQIDWLPGPVTGSYDPATVEAVRGFQAKREIPVTGEVDRRTLQRLQAMTYPPTHEQLYNLPAQPGQLDPRCSYGRVLCVDKSSRSLRWVIDGAVQATYDARFGSDKLPTREGEFHVYLKSRDHVSRLYDTSMPLAMFFSGGQAVHYSPDFAANGYSGASHGCVNIRDHDGITWLFDQVEVGDRVVVYWS